MGSNFQKSHRTNMMLTGPGNTRSTASATHLFAKARTLALKFVRRTLGEADGVEGVRGYYSGTGSHASPTMFAELTVRCFAAAPYPYMRHSEDGEGSLILIQSATERWLAGS